MRAIVVVLTLARTAAAGPALDTATTIVVPGTVPIQLVSGSTIDRHTGIASFDDGTSRFEVRVRELGARFDGQLDLVGLVDASERGVDIETARVDRIDGRVLVVPRATPNPLHELALVELAYVPWNREATLIMIYSDASAEELTRWHQLAGRMILATQVEPAVTEARVGPYVMRVPRAWTVTRHATFDELASRSERCAIRSIDDRDHSVPSDATNLRKRTWRGPDDEEWVWQVGDRMFYEFTSSDAGVRTRCEATDWPALKMVLEMMQSGRRAPWIPALARIHSLLR
jgi:hypothetical protein